MPDFDDLVQDLKRTRDEIRVQIHLASKEAQEEWEQLESRWSAFESKAELEKSAKDVGDAVKILGAELKEALTRIRKAL
ncbi:hypothetical protein FHR70_001034 [Microvirga lupini]|uniref:Uncharacterized protein n=1 Tax=Microvirga lupini TaxID=420324 RepID=A0A7W4VIU5_9HYPH|nr:hypothetical protein [Microvirga lupini]MBB3017994.1 hypothetical protein [Microvirga lupini]